MQFVDNLQAIVETVARNLVNVSTFATDETIPAWSELSPMERMVVKEQLLPIIAETMKAIEEAKKADEIAKLNDLFNES